MVSFFICCIQFAKYAILACKMDKFSSFYDKKAEKSGKKPVAYTLPLAGCR
jgi:hypothetical protein